MLLFYKPFCHVYTQKRWPTFKRSVSNFKSVLINSNLFIHFVLFELVTAFLGKCLLSFGQICIGEMSCWAKLLGAIVTQPILIAIPNNHLLMWYVFERRKFLEYFERRQLFSFNSWNVFFQKVHEMDFLNWYKDICSNWQKNWNSSPKYLKQSISTTSNSLQIP